MNISERAFEGLLEQYPHLGAHGLADPALCQQLQVDFAGERERLVNSFHEFAFCCDWLLDCTPLKHVSCLAPNSTGLAAIVAKRYGAFVPNGALVAAVLYLRLPHRELDDSPDIRVGISTRSPALNDACDEGAA